MLMENLFSPKIKKEIASIAKKHKIKLVMAFGSAVSGNLHERSDIDIAVLSEKSDVSFNEFADISYDLQGLFENYEVDLVILNHADPLLMKKIIENAKLLYGDAKDYSEFKIYAYKRYIDFKPFLKMEKQFAVDYPKRVKRAAG